MRVHQLLAVCGRPSRVLLVLSAVLLGFTCVALMTSCRSFCGPVEVELPYAETLWRIAVVQGGLQIDDGPQQRIIRGPAIARGATDLQAAGLAKTTAMRKLREAEALYEKMQSIDGWSSERVSRLKAVAEASSELVNAAISYNQSLIARNNALMSATAVTRYDIQPWAVFLISLGPTGISILMMIMVVRRRMARSRNNLCRHCGYDLRATPERCPECGQLSKLVGEGAV
jgi:hypothetical protein